MRKILKFTSDGDFIAEWRVDAPQGVALDGGGNLYVAEVTRIRKYCTDGTFVTQWGMPGSGPGEFDAAYGVAVDSKGHVYVTETGNHRVQKFGYVPVPTVPSTWGHIKASWR